MTVFEAARNLGEAIQMDEKFIRYAKAKLNNENDELLQNAIGEFNLIRMELDREVIDEQSEKREDLNQKLRAAYSDIMTNPVMCEYNTAKAELDSLVNDIYSIIGQCVEGADPQTVEPQTACTGSCETCAGCG